MKVHDFEKNILASLASTKVDGVAALIADSSNRQNPPIQQNYRNFWRNNAFFMFLKI